MKSPLKWADLPEYNLRFQLRQQAQVELMLKYLSELTDNQETEAS